VLTSECCEVDFVLKVMFIWLLVHPTVTSECCEVECCLVVAVLVRFRVLLLSGCLVLVVVLLSSACIRGWGDYGDFGEESFHLKSSKASQLFFFNRACPV
jgi:hypothetical protein